MWKLSGKCHFLIWFYMSNWNGACVSQQSQKLSPSCHCGPSHHHKSCSHCCVSPLNPNATWVSVALIPSPYSIYSNCKCLLSQRARKGQCKWAIVSFSCSLSPPIVHFPTKPLQQRCGCGTAESWMTSPSVGYIMVSAVRAVSSNSLSILPRPMGSS